MSIKTWWAKRKANGPGARMEAMAMDVAHAVSRMEETLHHRMDADWTKEIVRIRHGLQDMQMRVEVMQQEFQKMRALFGGHETMHADITNRLGQLAYLAEHTVLREELLSQFAKPLRNGTADPVAKRASLLPDGTG